jgi:hypothetical protein
MQNFIYICFVVSWVDYIFKYKCFMISFLFLKVVVSRSKFENCCLDICRGDKLLYMQKITSFLLVYDVWFNGNFRGGKLLELQGVNVF